MEATGGGGRGGGWRRRGRGDRRTIFTGDSPLFLGFSSLLRDSATLPLYLLRATAILIARPPPPARGHGGYWAIFEGIFSTNIRLASFFYAQPRTIAKVTDGDGRW